MKIYDVTPQIHTDHPNNYVFNPSVVHITDNIFMMTYRNILYNVSDRVIHPWEFWSHGFKLIRQQNPQIIEQNKHLNLDRTLYSIEKYKTCPSPDRFVNLTTVSNIQSSLVEFDGTGMCLLQFDHQSGQFSVIKNVPTIFGSDMNQDARMYNFDGRLMLTYNSFFIENQTKLLVKMMKTTIEQNNNFESIYLHPEEELLSGCATVEKNCILLDNDTVLYHINKGLVTYTSRDQYVVHPNSVLQNLSSQHFEVSLSTPAVAYTDDTYLSVGHIKVAYKTTKSDDFLAFFRSIDLTKIKQHGKYIYFMFFFTFDKNYNILQLSDFFIPTSEEHTHIPYLEVFASGLTAYNDGYIVSYGEGDMRCKLVQFSRSNVDFMLRTSNNKFIFVCPSDFLPKILHLGYFNKWNCGDDAFVKVFKYLNRLYPSYIASFTRDPHTQYSAFVLGGGDVINPYFMGEIDRHSCSPLLCMGVGIPYLDQIYLLNKFDKIVLRNSRDLPLVFEQKFDKQRHITSVPDFAWIMHRFYTPRCIFEKNIQHFRIGVALPRTYFNKQFVNEYKNLVIELAKMVDWLATENPENEIHLIPFCINTNNHGENDNIINDHLTELSNCKSSVFNAHIEQTEHYVEDILDYVSSMDFMICGRYHAHIFSALCSVPFVSLSCSRKCTELMKEWNLDTDYLYKFETNRTIIPVNFSHSSFCSWIQPKLYDAHLIEEVARVHSDNVARIDEMISTFISCISSYF